MSGPSYRLETPRPRRVTPSPLVFDNSTKSLFRDSDLLYDLPPTSGSSPPPMSSRSPARLVSPTSPTFRGRAWRNGRPTPPPSSRNRSQTPQGVAPSELEQFAEYCRAWYFQQDDNAGRLMTQTLTTLPSSQRAPFSRLQASIRSAYHRSVNARKNAEFRAHLSATTPGGSLLAHVRADPRGQAAQKERYQRLSRFIHTWCDTGMPGTTPFFESLWGIMRLQIIPENIGGAGPNRLKWEIDDAVFKESAGKNFMLEAIDVLKGVLGFEDVPSNIPDPIFQKSTTTSPSIPYRTKQIQSSVDLGRPLKIPSDPFLDAPSVGGSNSHSPNTDSILTASGQDADEPPSPRVTAPEIPSYLQNDESRFEEEEEHYLRVWTSPDLTDPELVQLVKLFPTFITRRTLPRFPPPSPRHLDIEEGEDDGVEERTIRIGTGTIWLSSKQRSFGWEGGWWERLLLWWRRIFC